MPDRIMVFVDGTNLLVELTKELDIKFRADKPPPSAFRYAQYWIRPFRDYHPVIRAFWFASYHGSDEYRDKIRSDLGCLKKPFLGPMRWPVFGFKMSKPSL